MVNSIKSKKASKQTKEHLFTGTMNPKGTAILQNNLSVSIKLNVFPLNAHSLAFIQMN